MFPLSLLHFSLSDCLMVREVCIFFFLFPSFLGSLFSYFFPSSLHRSLPLSFSFFIPSIPFSFLPSVFHLLLPSFIPSFVYLTFYSHALMLQCSSSSSSSSFMLHSETQTLSRSIHIASLLYISEGDKTCYCCAMSESEDLRATPTGLQG